MYKGGHPLVYIMCNTQGNDASATCASVAGSSVAGYSADRVEPVCKKLGLLFAPPVVLLAPARAPPPAPAGRAPPAAHGPPYERHHHWPRRQRQHESQRCLPGLRVRVVGGRLSSTRPLRYPRGEPVGRHQTTTSTGPRTSGPAPGRLPGRGARCPRPRSDTTTSPATGGGARMGPASTRTTRRARPARWAHHPAPSPSGSAPSSSGVRGLPRSKRSITAPIWAL